MGNLDSSLAGLSEGRVEVAPAARTPAEQRAQSAVLIDGEPGGRHSS